MRKTRITEKQIIRILKEVEAGRRIWLVSPYSSLAGKVAVTLYISVTNEIAFFQTSRSLWVFTSAHITHSATIITINFQNFNPSTTNSRLRRVKLTINYSLLNNAKAPVFPGLPYKKCLAVNQSKSYPKPQTSWAFRKKDPCGSSMIPPISALPTG